MQGAVPATLTGATVLPTRTAAEAFLAEHQALAIDVGAAPRATAEHGARHAVAAGRASGHPRQHLAARRRRRGAAARSRQPAFLDAVAQRTGNDPARFVMVYCHLNCWGSWNAAKRLVQAGYRNVAWFPAGIEGWAAADLPFQRTEPTALLMARRTVAAAHRRIPRQ